MIPEGTLKVLAECENVPPESELDSIYWQIVRAIKKFKELTGVLPLSGSVPDMTADSDSYISLQTLYV